MGNHYSLKKKTFVRVVVLTVYVLIWSAVFMFIEQTGEPNAVAANRMLEEVKNNISRFFGTNISEEHFDALVSKVSEAMKIKETPDWHYWQAVNFVAQSLTTIGFGAMTPRTTTGQMIFILFALIGLPLTMGTLKSTGELLHENVKKLIIFFERRFLQKQETKNICVKSFIFSFVMFIAFIISCAAIYVWLNRISYLEGIYASFVMLSTIGFGDYILDLNAAQSQNHVNDASMSVLIILNFPSLLICLTMVSCFLSSIMFLMESLRKSERKSCIRHGNAEGQDNPVAVTSTTDQEMATKTSCIACNKDSGRQPVD